MRSRCQAVAPRRCRAARRWAGGLACAVALLLGAAGDVAAYAFLLVPGRGGVVRRWDLQALPGGRVPWRLANAVSDNVVGDRGVAEVIEEAFAAWEAVADSGIAFAFAGGSPQRNRRGSDRVNLISLDPQESLGTAVLAATFLTSNAGGVLTDADVLFNPAVPYTTSRVPEADRYDLQEVAAHEIGHLIGLEHSAIVRATMVPYSDRGEAHGRTLASDDAIGAALLYPQGDVLERTGAIEGRVALDGSGVFLAHVIAATVGGRVVAGGFTGPDGRYRIAGLPPGVYVVLAEPLDGPVRPNNVQGFAGGFGGSETIGYASAFH
jgi:hypothetical protein